MLQYVLFIVPCWERCLNLDPNDNIIKGAILRYKMEKLNFWNMGLVFGQDKNYWLFDIAYGFLVV